MSIQQQALIPDDPALIPDDPARVYAVLAVARQRPPGHHRARRPGPRASAQGPCPRPVCAPPTLCSAQGSATSLSGWRGR